MEVQEDEWRGGCGGGAKVSVFVLNISMYVMHGESVIPELYPESGWVVHSGAIMIRNHKIVNLVKCIALICSNVGGTTKHDTRFERTTVDFRVLWCCSPPPLLLV